jgi:acyl carrier protein
VAAAQGPAFDDRATQDQQRLETPEQQLLAEIWAEVLERSDVGLNDDFFDLGGHSLLATQMVARIADRLGVRIELRTVFDRPTLAGLAEAIATARATEVPRVGAVARTAGVP